MPQPQLSPNTIAPDELAELLTAAGRRRVDLAMIQQDIADGAPTNADGTLNLMNYAAWLVKRTAEQGSGE